MARMTRWLVVFFVLLLLGLGSAAPATAHVRSTTGYSTVVQNGNVVTYRLALEYELFAKAIGMGAITLRDATDAERDDALAAARDKALGYIDERLAVTLDGVACEPSLDRTGVTRRNEAAYALFDLEFTCPGSSSGRFGITYDIFRESDAVAEDHSNVVDYRLDGTSGRVVLREKNNTLTVGDEHPAMALARFVQLGFEHILAGLDHILFVMALVIGARGAGDLVKVITTFTVSHSITLGLAAAGLVDVPASVVEPLIALSIAFVALDNLLGATSHRLAAVFGFGLLHGIGFAGALRIDGGSVWSFLVSLLGFNVGVELGQLLLIAAVLPVIVLARRITLPKNVSLVRVASPVATSLIAVVGGVWFVERLLAAPVA